MSNYFERAKNIQAETIANRRHIHANPEIGLDMPKTVEFVMQKLSEMGIEAQKCGEAGVTGLIGGQNSGKVVLLRADMDALPMAEESGLPFASTLNMAHTCGHDTHTAMLLSAAKLLKEDEANLKGSVKLMFQPGEEILAGAIDMVTHGLLENPKVDYAVGCHVSAKGQTGMLNWNSGPLSASSDGLNFTITGKGGHGASPQNSIDPINAGVHLYLAMQELISREVDPKEMLVITFGKFVSGDALNIIPEKAYLSGTMRSYNKETRNRLLERIKEICESMGKTYRVQIEFNHGPATLPMIVDKSVTDIVEKALNKVFDPALLNPAMPAMTGSEDFSEVLDRVPGMFFFLGAGSPEEGYHYGAHHPKVTYNEEAFAYGVAAYCTAANALME